jgi:hypothetical protein
MNSSDEMRTFLRDGLEGCYADAKELVTTFEKELQEQLMRQLEAKRDWSNFQATRGERGKNNAVYPGLWESGAQLAVYAMNNDDNDDNAGVELGISWGEHETGRPYLYTKRWEGLLRKLYLSDPKSPVQHRKGSLIVMVERGFELEAMAKLLLGETDRALAGVKTLRHTTA